MAKEKPTKKQKKKKRRFRKLFVSTAAFITAAVIVVFCMYYIYFKTEYFNIHDIAVTGNEVYDNEFIKEKSHIQIGEKLFGVDRSEVKENLTEQVYVEDARIVFELPRTVHIYITERREKFQIHYNDEYIITDKNGFVLRTDANINELITIETFADVLYNEGEAIEFSGIDTVKNIFDTIDYVENEIDSETVINVFIGKNNNILLETKYGTFIKLKLGEDYKYQIVFAIKIINERLNKNLPVFNGLIDFTKADSPVYIEDFKLEEYNE